MEPRFLSVDLVAKSVESPDSPLPRTIQDRAGEEYQVRLYSPSDRPAIQRFYEAFEPKRAAQGLPPRDSDRIARWLDQILNQGIHLIMLRSGTLLGHGLLVPTHTPGVSEYAIFLHQELRGRGLGTRMNELAVAAAKAAGLKGLWLSVEPHNRAALRSYEKVGFSLLPGTIFSPEAEMTLTF